MYKHYVLAGILLYTVGIGQAAAGCGAPSAQVQDLETTGFATAIVTFVTINGNGATSTVAGLTLTRTGSNIDPDIAATAFETVTNPPIPPSGTLSGAYSGWQVSPDQTGLTTTQVRYVATVPGTVPDIPVTAGSRDPSQVTTQGEAVGALSDLLADNTVCVGTGAPWENQEWHQDGGSGNSGDLWDWKLGNGHLDPSGNVDPTTQIGTWSITETGAATVVNYTYGGGSTYSFTVWKNTDADGPGLDTYSFCEGSTERALGRIYEGEISCTAGGTRL